MAVANVAGSARPCRYYVRANTICRYTEQVPAVSCTRSRADACSPSPTRYIMR